MDERLRFVARVLEGEPMTDLCREFGISRKTGYKIYNRYKDEGPVALCDRSEGPMTGEYHYVFKFGRDQGHLSRQMEVNGNLAIEYNAYGEPISHAKFTPIGDKDINFDPIACDLREAKANE